MRVQLIVEENGQAIPINLPSFTIGRAKEANLRSPSTHVSRQHCVIHTHNDTVTIQDLGGDNGTYVNGKRISSSQVLENGDKITVGKHVFTLSIGDVPVAKQVTKPVVVPAETPEPLDSELMFEIRYEGQLVSVTKERLFDLARKGRVSPDDLVTIAGTKVFADSIDGIVFGDKPSAPPPPPPPTMAIPVVAPAPASVAPPFEKSPSGTIPLAQAPIARKKSSYRAIDETDETTGSRLNASVSNNFSTSVVQALGVICVLACLFFGGWYFFVREVQPEGILYIEGTLVLDGTPVQGADVTLIPRSEGGREAFGLTNSSGKFKVTTDSAPAGSGVRAGEYDVTFSKRELSGGKKYVIPKKYDTPNTSGIEPIKIEAGGKKSFHFELFSESTMQPPDTPQQEAKSAPD